MKNTSCRLECVAAMNQATVDRRGIDQDLEDKQGTFRRCLKEKLNKKYEQSGFDSNDCDENIYIQRRSFARVRRS